MKVRCFKGIVKKMRPSDDGSCRIDVDLGSDGEFCLEIDKKSFEFINYNLEEVRKIKPNFNMRDFKVNLYRFKKGVRRLELHFNKLYAVSVPCKIQETKV